MAFATLPVMLLPPPLALPPKKALSCILVDDEPDRFFDDKSAQMMGQFGFFKPANIGPGWMRSAKPQRSDFERLMQMSFQHLLSAHGTPLKNDARAQIQATIDAAFSS